MRSEEEIRKELKEAKKILKRTKELIKKYPNDNALPIDKITFEHRVLILEEELKRVLGD